MRKPAFDGCELKPCRKKSCSVLLTSFIYSLTVCWLICITETQTALTVTLSTTPKKQVRGRSKCFEWGISPPPLMAFNRAPAFWLLSSCLPSLSSRGNRLLSSTCSFCCFQGKKINDQNNSSGVRSQGTMCS